LRNNSFRNGFATLRKGFAAAFAKQIISRRNWTNSGAARAGGKLETGANSLPKETAPAAENRSLLTRAIARPEFGPFVLLAIELVGFWSINHDFLSVQNISNTLVFTVELGLIALAMTLLMTAGEFDLSVGSLFGFSPVVMWTLFNSGATSLALAFLIAMAGAALIGLVNGWFVTRLKIPSFLVTLGMLLVVRGTALFVTDGFPQRTWSAGNQWLANVLVGDFYVGDFRIYMSLFWFIGAVLITGYLLTQTRFGNWIQAAGGNPGAARARGVNVDKVKVILFAVSAMMSALAGIISSIRTSAANPNSGTGYELEVIAMVVIGGTALTGGRGTIVGTVLGIFILRVMRNGIVLIGVPGLAYNIFIGAIILGMMALHSWLERRHQAGT
jgi:simple sugar transport system permease protein